MKPYDSLVLSGGGIKGIASLGAVSYFQKHGHLDHVKYYVGTSVGAVIVAALSIGKDPVEMFRENVLGFTYRPDVDISLLDKTFGFDSGLNLEKWLETIFPSDLTFATAHMRYQKKLVICVTNLNARHAEYLSADTTPDMTILAALRMSCSVPLYFSAITYEGNLYVDGGVCDNFPVEHTFELGAQRILGIKFTSKEKKPGAPWCVDQFFGALVEASIVRRQPLRGHIMALDAGSSTQPLDFRLPPEDMKKLFNCGVQQAALFVKKNQ